MGNSASFTFYNTKESHLHLTKLICCWQSGNDWGFVCSVQMWPPVLLFCAISLCRRLRRQAPAVCDYPVLLTEYDLLHKDAAVPFIIHRFVNTDALRILNVCGSVVSKLWLKPKLRWVFIDFYVKESRVRALRTMSEGKSALFPTGSEQYRSKQQTMWGCYNSYLLHAGHLRFSHSLCFSICFFVFC